MRWENLGLLDPLFYIFWVFCLSGVNSVPQMDALTIIGTGFQEVVWFGTGRGGDFAELGDFENYTADRALGIYPRDNSHAIQ